jgi:hypothetical protein
MSDAAPKSSGDFLRFFVVVMALMAGVMAWFWQRSEAEAAGFRRANEGARALFGDEKAGVKLPPEQSPRTIRGLAVGLLEYLATNRDARKDDKGGLLIPTSVIRDRLQGAGLKQTNIGQENVNKFQGAKRFEEVSVAVTIEPCDMYQLATFLYTVEQSSPIYRILDVRWELRPERENPYNPGTQPGHLIGRPTVKIGFRRPLTGAR